MNLEELKRKIEEKQKPVTVINRGITPLSLLGIAFVVMKVMGYITWSWWWVLAPFWIPVALALFLLLLVIGIVILLLSIDSKTVKVTKTVTETKTTKRKPRAKKEKEEDGEAVTRENG